ncbi:MAG: thiaminase II [Candidatus Binataceae bacterium]
MECRFSAALRERATPVWRLELAHPFVRGIADGTLTLECFRFYLRQDYLFLIEYCRVFALAAAKAPDLETMRLFSRLMHDTLHGEMELHRDFCRRLGITADEMEHTEPAPTTHAYTRHLLNVAWSGTLAEIVSALMPCQLGYAKIGGELARVPGWERSPYAEWIRTYSSTEFVASAERLRVMLDEMTAGWPAAALVPLTNHFMLSTRYEYLFWEMAWNQAGWPV